MSWMVDAKSPLVFGDGRSIGNIGGVRSLELPWPSTLSGMVRTLAGTNENSGFDTTEIARVKQIAVQGPWLYSLTEQQAYFVMPKDMVWNRVDSGNQYTVTQLVCAQTNTKFPDGIVDTPMTYMVFPSQELPEGKISGGPSFCSENQLTEWLLQPQNKTVSASSAGVWGLLHDERTHVAIEWESKTARDGDLFSTDGVLLQLSTHQEFAIGFTTDTRDLDRWKDKPCFLGGERRVSYLRHSDRAYSPSAELIEKLMQQNVWRVVFVTSGLFEEGACPDALCGQQILSYIVGRPQSISGWDYELKGPKPSRRMVPAGSVYWIDVSQLSTEEKQGLLTNYWMKSSATNEQYRLDGFGIIVFGVGQ